MFSFGWREGEEGGGGGGVGTTLNGPGGFCVHRVQVIGLWYRSAHRLYKLLTDLFPVTLTVESLERKKKRPVAAP